MGEYDRIVKRRYHDIQGSTEDLLTQFEDEASAMVKKRKKSRRLRRRDKSSTDARESAHSSATATATNATSGGSGLRDGMRYYGKGNSIISSKSSSSTINDDASTAVSARRTSKKSFRHRLFERSSLEVLDDGGEWKVSDFGGVH